MANRRSYRDLERVLTILLLACAADFILYLIFAGVGIIWLKVLTAIFAILMSVLCLVLLFLTQELMKQRSLWMTTGFVGIFLCTVVSLIANFPSPL